jgi:hypothetical protein
MNSHKKLIELSQESHNPYLYLIVSGLDHASLKAPSDFLSSLDPLFSLYLTK